MFKSKDILQQKANESRSLKSTIDQEKVQTGDEHAEVPEPKTIYDEDGKKIIVFHDPLYSREKRSIVNYTMFNGRWEFENMDQLDETDPEKCAVRFSPQSEGAQITIVFKSIKDRVEFMDSIYSDKEMKQVGGGMSLENLANSKVLKTTGGLIGLSIASYGLYKLFKGKKEEE